LKELAEKFLSSFPMIFPAKKTKLPLLTLTSKMKRIKQKYTSLSKKNKFNLSFLKRN